MSLSVVDAETQRLVNLLQRLLDQQAEGLRSGNDRMLTLARQGISCCMERLRDLSQKTVNFYEIEKDKFLAESAFLDELRIEKRDLRARSPHAIELLDLESRKKKLMSRIDSFRLQISSLEAELRSLEQREVEVSSIIESKLASIDKETERARAWLELTDVQDISERIESMNKESEALGRGMAIWNEVQGGLNSLQQELQAAIPANDLRAARTAVSTLLQNLKDHLQAIRENKWALLDVAVSQEIAALELALKMIAL